MCADDAIKVIAERLNESVPDRAGLALAELLLELQSERLCAENEPEEPISAGEGRPYHETVLEDFVLEALNSLEDPAGANRLVHLCGQREYLLGVALSYVDEAVTRDLAKSVHNDDFAVPAAPHVYHVYLNTTLGNDSFRSSIASTPYPPSVSIPTTLVFLEAFVQSNVRHVSSLPPRLLVLLALLAGVKPRNIADCARRILLATIKASDQYFAKSCEDECKSTQVLLWRRVFEFTECVSESFYVNIGLKLWLGLLTISPTPWRSAQLPVNDSYWQWLHFFLASGSFEQRKICLAILRQSIKLLTESFHCPYMKYDAAMALEYQTQFDKYATIFETVILARYFNQVQECIPHLNILCRATSVVHPSWIVTLLHASQLHGMQDSIRNLLGMWSLQHAPSVLSATITTCDFLQKAFLDWATAGYHYVFVTKRSSSSLRCVFGEKVIEFVAKTVLLSQNRSDVVDAILKFLVHRGERIFSFSRSFVLEGLLNGLREAHAKLGPEHVAQLSTIAQHQGFQELVRDLMVLQTSELIFDLGQCDELSNPSLFRSRNAILSLVTSNSRAKYLEAKQFFFNDMMEYPIPEEKLLTFLTSEERLVSHPLQQFEAWIQHSNRLCLAGPGLKAACDFLSEVLATQTIIEMDMISVTRILNAIWNEVERRQYPKAVIMLLPKIFLHPQFIQFLPDESELAATMEKFAKNLFKMSRTRIYLFSPLAAAIRYAVLAAEEAKFLPLVEFVEMYIVDPPEARYEFNLARAVSKLLEKRSPGRAYEFYYGKPVEFGHACMFDMLNSLPVSDAWDQVLRQIVDNIVYGWSTSSKQKTTAQLQVLVLALERLTPRLSSSRVSEYLSRLEFILQNEPVPRYRFLMEWAIMRVYFNVPEARHNALRRFSASHYQANNVDNPKYIVSTIKVAVAVACFPDVDEDFGEEVLAVLTSHCASQKVAVRYEAQWAFPKLWKHALMKDWKRVISNVPLQQLNRWIRELEAFQDPPAARLLSEFDAISDHNLTFLLQGKYLMIEPSERPLVTREDVLNMRKEEKFDAQQEIMALAEINNSYEDGSAEPQPLESEINEAADTPLQTKSTVTDIDNLSNEHPRQSKNVIVMASLIDNPHNLGGISRVSEIFGVKLLKVKNTSVTKHRDFTSVSVSSHSWFPVEELKIPQISEFFRQCKTEGYKIVGIEQTDSSVVLGREGCQLPKDLVFVLGSEKEGIPAELLSETDLCVEISQAGITRSMNVQTALSVALYEHQRQHH